MVFNVFSGAVQHGCLYEHLELVSVTDGFLWQAFFLNDKDQDFENTMFIVFPDDIRQCVLKFPGTFGREERSGAPMVFSLEKNLPFVSSSQEAAGFC